MATRRLAPGQPGRPRGHLPDHRKNIRKYWQNITQAEVDVRPEAHHPQQGGGHQREGKLIRPGGPIAADPDEDGRRQARQEERPLGHLIEERKQVVVPPAGIPEFAIQEDRVSRPLVLARLRPRAGAPEPGFREAVGLQLLEVEPGQVGGRQGRRAVFQGRPPEPVDPMRPHHLHQRIAILGYDRSALRAGQGGAGELEAAQRRADALEAVAEVDRQDAERGRQPSPADRPREPLASALGGPGERLLQHPDQGPEPDQEEVAEFGEQGQSQEKARERCPPHRGRLRGKPVGMCRGKAQRGRTDVGRHQPPMRQDVRAEAPERQAQQPSPVAIQPPRPREDGEPANDREHGHQQAGGVEDLEVFSGVDVGEFVGEAGLVGISPLPVGPR